MKMAYMKDYVEISKPEAFDIKHYQCQGKLNMIDRLKKNEWERICLEDSIKKVFGNA
jgi:hypothetical protein